MNKKRIIVLIIILVVFAWQVVSAQLPPDFDVQGHRGARGLKPENTLPAFETALDLGVTTLELDLHYTADNVIVVWHDDAINRESCYLPEASDIVIPTPDSLIFGGSSLRIRGLTLEQIKGFVCDMNPNTDQYPDQSNAPTAIAGDDYHIATLREVFELVETYAQSDLKTDEQRASAVQVRFNIESKRKVNDSSAIDDDFDGENIGEFEQAVVSLIEEFELTDRVVIQSFDHRVIWAVKSAYPDIIVAALTDRARPQFDLYVQNGASIWSPRYSALTQEWIDEAHALDIKVIPWTINDPNIMRDMINMGVDGIITDFPDVLLTLGTE